MTTPDLTEKLKELLMSCDLVEITRIFNHGTGYYPSESLARTIAKQLAPEIEKMMPRWIPVSERLPEDGFHVLAEWWQGDVCIAHIRDGVWWYRGNTGMKAANVPPVKWMPIMKGPM